MEGGSAATSQESISLPRHIPEHIIFGKILPGLPPKSLLRFRCVNKGWNSLISSPQFKKTQLQVSSNLSRNFIVLGSCNVPEKSFICSETSILTNRLSLIHINISIQRVIGTQNGLLCLATTENSIILCNPSTKRYIRLINSAPTDLSLGFCYDRLNDDYKVVMLLGLKATVFSLRQKRFIEIEGFHGGVFGDDDAICVSGRLHWSAVSNLNDPPFILSLDVVTYQFGMVELPEIADCHGNWTLHEFGGRLGLICDYSRVRVDVLLMKIFGNRSSWTILSSLPYLKPPPEVDVVHDVIGDVNVYNVDSDDNIIEDDDDEDDDDDDDDYEDKEGDYEEDDDDNNNDIVSSVFGCNVDTDDEVIATDEEDDDVKAHTYDEDDEDDDEEEDDEEDNEEDDDEGQDEEEEEEDEEGDNNDDVVGVYPNVLDVVARFLKSVNGQILLNNPDLMQNNSGDGSFKYHEICIDTEHPLRIQSPSYIQSLEPLLNR